jgi:hypothetical protein
LRLAARPFGGAFPVELPGFQTEDGSQDLLAAGGRLLGKLVGAPLQEERDVDEGFIVQAKNLLDARLGIAQGAFGKRAPGARTIDGRR